LKHATKVLTVIFKLGPERNFRLKRPNAGHIRLLFMKEVNIVLGQRFGALPLVVELIFVARFPAGVDMTVYGCGLVLFEFLSCIPPLRVSRKDVAVLLPVLTKATFAGSKALITSTHTLGIRLAFLPAL